MVCGTICSCGPYPPPAMPVPKATLVGTWQWRSHDEYGFATKPDKPSLMILRNDGRYEIHNPPTYIAVPAPKYVRESIADQAKYYRSPACGLIVVGKWSGDGGDQKINRAIRLKGLEFQEGFLGGKTAPFIIYQYWCDPDVIPSEKWDWVSKEMKCPNCLVDVFDEKNVFPLEELKKREQEREDKVNAL